jgi:hypothetical protein
MKYYVYRHVTASEGIPFYIGKGSRSRAYVTNYRSKFWHSIVKAHGYKVEFIAKHLNEIEAFYLENFYIKLYGRRHTGGLLVNQTDGGEGQSGAIVSHARRELMRTLIRGKILKQVNAEALIQDYKKLLNLRRVCDLHGICIATAMKYIPKDLRQESRSANGRLNSTRLLGKKPWNYGKANPSN